MPSRTRRAMAPATTSGEVAGHGAGVAQAEVRYSRVWSTSVLSARLWRILRRWGESAGPFFHPVHGKPPEEGGLGALVRAAELGVGWSEIEEGRFALVELAQFLADQWLVIVDLERNKIVGICRNGQGSGAKRDCHHPLCLQAGRANLSLR